MSEKTKPAEHAASITPNDTTDLTHPTRALVIGAAGNLKVDMAGGETVTFTAVYGRIPISVTRVYATGTTATSIVAIW